jgi:hypothetical protein
MKRDTLSTTTAASLLPLEYRYSVHLLATLSRVWLTKKRQDSRARPYGSVKEDAKEATIERGIVFGSDRSSLKHELTRLIGQALHFCVNTSYQLQHRIESLPLFTSLAFFL